MRTIFNEQFMYSYSTTLKSILTENKKLKKKFNITGRENWINSNFFKSGLFSPWSFKGKRRILSYDRILDFVKRKNFFCAEYRHGGIFFYKANNFISRTIFEFFNLILNALYQLKLFNFILKRISSSNIFLFKKN